MPLEWETIGTDLPKGMLIIRAHMLAAAPRKGRSGLLQTIAAEAENTKLTRGRAIT